MATSGSFTFAPEFADLATETWERIGKARDSMPGDLARSARFSVNLILQRWATKGIHLWAIDLQMQALAAADPDYPAPVGTVAVLDAYVTTGTPARDLIITAISRSTYAALTDKLQESDRPTQFYFDRQTSPIIYVWPVLRAGAAATLNYYRLRRLQSVTTAAETVDLPELGLDALCAWLAMRFAEKWAPERFAEKKQEAIEAFADFKSEYQQRVKTIIRPDFSGYRVT
jgi:hypothetical protein